MCHFKRLCLITLLSLFVLTDVSYGRRTKKNRPKTEEEETTPQPNVVTYSTFGFNDVGQTYDGFVPSSPDYASYLSHYNQESSTRLYGPAFPTAMDNGYNGYEQQAQETQQFVSGSDGDNIPQASMLQYDATSYNFANSQFGAPESDGQGQGMQENSFNQNENYNSPIYGAKLNTKHHKNKSLNQYNNTGMYENNFNSDKYKEVHETQSGHESKPSYGESSNNFYSGINYAPAVNEDVPKPEASTGMKFPKVVDFTKFKPTYPTEVESKYAPITVKPNSDFKSMMDPLIQNDHSYMNFFSAEKDNVGPPKYSDNFENDEYAKPTTKPPMTNYMEFSINHIESGNTKHERKPFTEFKDKQKYKPYNFSAEYNNWKNYVKNYDQFKELTNSSFKRPYKGYDEVTSASNNIIDFTNIKFPENEYFSSFKRNPEQIKLEFGENYPAFQPFRSQENSVLGEDYFNKFKHLYSTSPSTTSSWGNVFKTTESPPYKNRLRRPPIDDDVVHIPKRHKFHIKNAGKNVEWSAYTRHNPGRGKTEDWAKDVPSRFKSEEDLLGLRTHDTSHPSYTPFKATNDAAEEYKKYLTESEYRSLVEKWKHSYAKSKYAYRDHDAYGSDNRPTHVPVPKPYPIEVPHPVIVPVPQPYPVRVPVPKPVAVPVYRELTVSVEKPVPYPVIKRVPYPVEKPVPVPVEKEVKVPVIKPYAVPIPHVRPIFHHSRPHDDIDSERENEFEEDDYLSRPSPHSNRGKKVTKYSTKKIRSNRNHSKRPTHSSHYERNRRRSPTHTPSYRSESSRSRRTRPLSSGASPNWHRPRYQEEDIEDYDHEHSEYYEYCKRSGNC